MGEFLRSLEVTDALDARLALAGHARPFTDIRGHIEANRQFVEERLAAVRDALRSGPLSAFEVARAIYGEHFNEEMGGWLMALTRAWLVHLQALGEIANDGGDPVQHWRLTS